MPASGRGQVPLTVAEGLGPGDRVGHDRPHRPPVERDHARGRPDVPADSRTVLVVDN
jgi:hypothetical protein